MDPNSGKERPAFDQALSAWKALLAERGLPAECLWVFDENLCFEKAEDQPGGYRLGIQTRFTPPPPNAEQIAWEYLSEFDCRLVFYRLGTLGTRSVCLLLCDEWFEAKDAAEGYVRREDWGVSFHPGNAVAVEEIQDENRWKNRIIRDRPLHDLDFCMTLRAVHETLAHGRVLSSYEHYALRFLHLWRRVLD